MRTRTLEEIRQSGIDLVINLNQKDFTQPDHYPGAGSDDDLIGFCLRHQLDGMQFTIMRYILRAGRKQGEPTLKDLRKAVEYIQRWIAFEEAKEDKRNG